MTTNGTVTPDKLHKLELTVNALSTQLTRERMARALGGTMYDGKREIDTALGFTPDIRFIDYYSMYRRDQTAKRLVKLPAQESWKLPPVISDGASQTIYPDDITPEPDTPFIAGLKQIIKKPKLWRYLRRVDKLTGIGHYGVLLIGARNPIPTFTGASFLAQPVTRLRSPDDIVYFRAFGENKAEIIDTLREQDSSSPRYGLPNFYRLDLGNGAAQVHHSRIIHIAEELEDNELIGTPRLEAVFDMLQSLKMVWGAGAEAVWRDALKKYIVNILQDTDFDGTANSADRLALDTEMENFYHGLKSYLQLRGAEVDTVGPAGIDVSPIFDILIKLISGDIPQAVLLGAQAGELASAQQDEKTMARFIAARQQQFCEPDILRPTLDWLIENGALPPPSAGEYGVHWQTLFEQDEKTEAETRKLNAEAQEIEWRGSGTPVATRLKQVYGEEALDDLIEDEMESAAFTNFEPVEEQ